MANLYITEQGAVLRKTGDRLIVEKDAELFLDIPCSKVDAVLIFGNVQFTTQAVHEILQHGIEMAILTRSGKLLGHISSLKSKNVELRIEQFNKYMDDAFRLTFSKILVKGKVTNCLNLIRIFSYNHPDRNLSEIADQLRVLTEDSENAGSIASLMGTEGASARVYFECLGRMILGEFTFDGRKKHPSTDPVNALLSFGYTLVFNEVLALLESLGFDPCIGFFHEVEYGRASLASDLVEEFRASVDRFTLYLVNNKIFNKEDFYTNPENKAVYLQREALKRYVVEYERLMSREFIHPELEEHTTLRKCLKIQAEKLANFLRSGIIYTTFALEV